MFNKRYCIYSFCIMYYQYYSTNTIYPFPFTSTTCSDKTLFIPLDLIILLETGFKFTMTIRPGQSALTIPDQVVLCSITLSTKFTPIASRSNSYLCIYISFQPSASVQVENYTNKPMNQVIMDEKAACQTVQFTIKQMLCDMGQD